jgi:hypothetical protein
MSAISRLIHLRRLSTQCAEHAHFFNPNVRGRSGNCRQSSEFGPVGAAQALVLILGPQLPPAACHLLQADADQGFCHAEPVGVAVRSHAIILV